MNHRVFGRKLHRNRKGRAQLFKVLVHNFVVHGRLVTTEAKAKAVRPLLEKLVTKAKKGETQRSLLLKETGGNKEVVSRLLQIAKIFSQVPGGYTKLIKMPVRMGDNGRQLLMTWSRDDKTVESEPVVAGQSASEPSVKTKQIKKTNKK